ncbi:phage exclusion protein Lit family protein [Dickeya solani]|uniref:Phage exclusion protein Lit family protein n=1 Tax=Dickeya solani TaxID=1089444 RepID=A0AAX4EZ26_9GAMM|nr:phage exclusion protein Lit family protein [Dickeya solani]WOA52332.1 phage exclusion protein Lit family protein [Dickeya solani]
MSEDYNGDHTVQDGVRNMFSGSIPERKKEIDDFWSYFDMNFQIHEDDHPDGKYIFDAGMYKFIRFNHRVLRIFWIGSFSAMAGYIAINESLSKKLDEFNKKRDTILEKYSHMGVMDFPDQLALNTLLNNFTCEISNHDTVDFSFFNELIRCFENSTIDNLSDEKPLPAGVPEPGVLPDKEKNPIGRATAEVAIIAAAWAFLHEVRHILHQQQGTSYDPYDFTEEEAHAEELSCDEFATKFILDNIDDYCDQSGYDLDLVRKKRKLAIYIALFNLALLTKDNWGSSKTHPSLKERMDNIQLHMKYPNDQDLETIVTSMFTALRNIWPEVPTIEF